MKKLLPLLLITVSLLFGSKAHSTSYLDKNPEWMVSVTNSLFPGYYTSFSYYLDGDTLINNKLYHQLYQGTWRGNERFAFIREENRRTYIYGLYPSFEEDILLYDFNLEEGDEFTTNAPNYTPEYGKVSKVGTQTMLNGDERKTIELYGQWWIEGVGSLSRLLSPITQSASDGSGYSLACYKENGEVLYQDEDACKNIGGDCCLIWGTSISETIVSDNNIQIEKADNCFIVTFADMNDRTKTIQLIDLSGKVVKEVRTTDESYNLDMQDYENGVYLLQAQCGQAKSVTKVIKSERF